MVPWFALCMKIRNKKEKIHQCTEDYCKSRIFRTHSVFVAWALRPFVRMKLSHSRWPLRIIWLALYLSHAFCFRTEATAYEMYENNMHTKYSGFTVFSINWRLSHTHNQLCDYFTTKDNLFQTTTRSRSCRFLKRNLNEHACQMRPWDKKVGQN